MEIHKYEKIWFGVSLLLIVGFIATITYGAVGAGVDMVSDDGGTVDPNNINEHEKFQDWPQTQAQHVEGDQYEVAVQAIRFNFLPETIEVPANSEVTFYITSPDVTHGFQVVGTNVNTMVIPGQMTKITVEFDDVDERTEYGILCNEFCGAGHERMSGQIVVVPEDEWNEGGDE